MGNKGKRSNVRWIRFSLLLLYLVSLLSTTAMAASPPKTQDVWFTHFARQDYRNQNGNFGGVEVESPETVAVGTPVSLRLFYQADPNQGAVPFHAEVTWGSGFRAGTYSIQLTADPFAFSTSDTRVFHAERPVFSGGSYVSPTTGRLDLFEMFEVASLSDLWIKFRVVDENGVVLEDRSCDWTGRTVEGTDAYTVTPNAGEINLVMYVGATKDDETVPEEEVDQAKLMMAEPEKAVAFTLSASGGITLRTASPQTLTFADYDPERAAAEAAGYNLYVASYVRNGAAVLGDEPGTLTMRSSILGSPYLTTHVWQHAYMDAYMNYPDTSIVRTLPVTAPSGNTTAGSASDAATPDETAESGASDSQSELEPVLPLPVPLSMPQAAAVGGTGLGAVGLLGILAAFHAKDYAALKPVLRQLSELAGATGLLSAQGMAAPAAETAASAEDGKRALRRKAS